MKAMFDPAVRVPCAVCSAALFIFLVGAPALADSPLLSMSDPAAAYCESLGYTYEIADGDGGQYGVCVLPDGRRVDAWAFYRGKVAQDYSYCARQGLNILTKAPSPLSVRCASRRRGGSLGRSASSWGFSSRRQGA